MNGRNTSSGRIIASAGVILASCLLCFSAYAFQVSPSGTALERFQVTINKAWYARYTTRVAELGIYQFTHPVHEEITQLVFGCDAGPVACSDPDIGFAPAAVVAGVRWNDDPPFRLTTTGIPECKANTTIRVVTQPTCWYKLFKHAEKRAKTTYFDGKSSRWNIMYRSHFGDLQFLHAMATRDGETAGETRARILMWSQFAWSVATGTADSNTLLKEVSVEGIGALFPRSGQNVMDLYTLGNGSLRRELRSVAFGNLLHLVQDSFAFGHVQRSAPVAGATCPGTNHPRPGLVRQFRSYTNQNHKIHGKYDSRAALEANMKLSPNVVDVGRVLLDMYDRKEPWEVVGPYLGCVFDVEDAKALAAAGDGLL